MVNDVVYWYRNGVLTDGSNEIALAADTDRVYAVSNGTRAAILYADVNDDFSTTIYASINDGGAWGEPVALFHSDRYISALSGNMLEDGTIEIVAGESLVGEDGVQSARVVLYQVEKECNLQMTDLDYDVLSSRERLLQRLQQKMM